jgi:hypothetical protein
VRVAVPSVPLGPFVPLHPPVAVQDVALVELHVSVEVPPLATEIGFAVSVAVGVPGTVTVAVATLLIPPAPVQINEYEFVAVSAAVPWVPLVALVPLQPPEAVQEVALVELHVSVEAPPLATEVGFAVNVTVGAGTTLTLAVATLLVPPAPAQVNEYEPAIVRDPVLCVPLVGSVPLQLPEAAHEVALVEVHVSVEAPPLATDVGFAVSVTVGACVTVTVAEATLRLPSAPVQAPDAVHDVVPVELHVNVEEPPLAIAVGAALRDVVGCVIGVTPAPPHAANSRDAPAGQKLRADPRQVRLALRGVLDRNLNWFDWIDDHRTNHELTVIEFPHASRNSAMLIIASAL